MSPSLPFEGGKAVHQIHPYRQAHRRILGRYAVRQALQHPASLFGGHGQFQDAFYQVGGKSFSDRGSAPITSSK